MTTLSAAEIWLVIVLAGVGTFSIRLSLLALLGARTTIPPTAQRALRLVPPAVLAALITPALFRFGGDWDLWNARLAAGALAAVVAWRTKNVIATLVVGMVVLWVLQAL